MAGDVLAFNVTALDVDNDTITYSTNASNGTLNQSTGEYTWATTSLDIGTYVWHFNSSDAYGGTASETINITITSRPVYNYIPPDPVNLTNMQGNFWINHTWQPGPGNRTDSFNVSVDGIWTNGSESPFNNASVPPHGWKNITVWAYNNSGNGTISNSSISLNTQRANNIPVQMPIGNKVLYENELLQFRVSAVDADSDMITYASNASRGTFDKDTGQFTWTPGTGDAGYYTWYFNSVDSYGGIASEIITIRVRYDASLINFSHTSTGTCSECHLNGDVNNLPATSSCIKCHTTYADTYSAPNLTHTNHDGYDCTYTCHVAIDYGTKGRFDPADHNVNWTFSPGYPPTADTVSLNGAAALTISRGQTVTISSRIKDAKYLASRVQGAEYYIDSDPGSGNGTAMIATDGRFDAVNGAWESITGTIDTSSLSPGIHTVSVRGMDIGKQWSSARSANITIVQ